MLHARLCDRRGVLFERGSVVVVVLVFVVFRIWIGIYIDARTYVCIYICRDV